MQCTCAWFARDVPGTSPAATTTCTAAAPVDTSVEVVPTASSEPVEVQLLGSSPARGQVSEDGRSIAGSALERAPAAQEAGNEAVKAEDYEDAARAQYKKALRNLAGLGGTEVDEPHLPTMKRHTRGATQDSPLLLATPDEVAITIASFLSAHDLLRLSIACKRYHLKIVASPADAAQAWSIAAEAARRLLMARTVEQRVQLPLHPSNNWLSCLHEAEIHEAPLRFAVAHPDLELADDGSSVTNTTSEWREARTLAVMRAGRHYAEFVVDALCRCGEPVNQTETLDMLLGVIRPHWDVTDATNDGARAIREFDHSFYWTSNGFSMPHTARTNSLWPGSQSANFSDRVGLLLDLNAGTLSVFKNDELLGEMRAGLSGPYCWAVDFRAHYITEDELQPTRVTIVDTID